MTFMTECFVSALENVRETYHNIWLGNENLYKCYEYNLKVHDTGDARC
jgi:hypothetical protein